MNLTLVMLHPADSVIRREVKDDWQNANQAREETHQGAGIWYNLREKWLLVKEFNYPIHYTRLVYYATLQKRRY